MLDYGVQRCQMTEVVFTKMLVNDILGGFWITQVLD